MKEILEYMAFDELVISQLGQATSIVVASRDGWYFKGQKLVIMSIFPDNTQHPLCRYVCIESGRGNSIWEFEKELY